MALSPQLTDYIKHEQARLHVESERYRTLTPVVIDEEIPPAIQHSNAELLILATLPSTLIGEIDALNTTIAVINASDLREENALIELRWLSPNGTVYEEQQHYVTIEPNATTEITSLVRPLSDVESVSILDLALWTFQDFLPTVNRYVLVRGQHWDALQAVPTTALEVRRMDSSGFITLTTLTNVGSVAAFGIHLDADGVQFGDNDLLCLLPAEARSISIEWQSEHAPTKIGVTGWNIATVMV